MPGTDDELDDSEDWGPAVAVLAARFPWRQDALRIVVPISDEDPQNGDATDEFDTVCEDPGSDRAAIQNAITQAQSNNVVVSPIFTDQSDFDPEDQETLACVEPLMQSLADGTGGRLNASEDPSADLAGAIVSLIEAACTQVARE